MPTNSSKLPANIFIEISNYQKMEITAIKGIGRVYKEKLGEAGIESIEELIVADLEELAKKTGISVKRLQEWQREARKLAEYKKAEIAEDMTKITSIEIEDGKARVKIKEIIHENIPVFKGNFDELKAEMEKEEMAVFVGKKAKLWFNGVWYDNLPYKMKGKEGKKKKGLLDKLRELWRK